MKLRLLLAAIAALGCSESDFSEQRNEPKAFSDIEEKETKEQGGADSIASEPVMVGGGFLACFASQPSELGCNLYEDEKYKKRMVADAAITLENLSDEVSQVFFDPTHPSWTWRFLFDKPLGSQIELKALVGSEEIEISVPIKTTLPASLLLDGQLLGKDVKLRDKKSGLCLSGNSSWTRTELEGSPVEYYQFTMQLEACERSVDFQWTQWSQQEKHRFRLHTLGPSVHPDGCNPDFFDQALCQRACLDLAEFGVGPQVELFGCTNFENTEKAQRIELELRKEGSFSLRVNELSLGYIDDTGIGVKAELEPLIFEMFVSEIVANTL